MDNNLSELSKPVQIFKHPSGRNFWAVMADSTAGQNGVEPFYSQEYVSALLAELEEKDKRIATLKNEFGELWKGNVDLLARLATPVQASRWISWHGGMFRPVRSDTIIDVMFANGNMKPNICAGSVVFEWQKTPKDSQRVTAYRLHRREGSE